MKILVGAVAYLAFFLISILTNNYLLLYYTSLVIIITLFAAIYHKKVHLSPLLAFAFVLFMVLHFIGLLHIADTRIYDLWIIQIIKLRYDNIMHLLGAFIATIVAYNILIPYLDPKVKQRPILLTLLLVLIALGIGAINEIVELIAIALFNIAEIVGDYMNNALDMLFNLFGSLLAVLIIQVYHKKEVKDGKIKKSI